MNKERRAAIAKIADELRDIQIRIEDLKSEEQDYHDNMPESFQSGEKGEKAQAAISALEDAESNIDSAISDLETAGE